MAVAVVSVIMLDSYEKVRGGINDCTSDGVIGVAEIIDNFA